MKPALNFTTIDPVTIQCRTCNHFCILRQGQVGICGVRQNIGGVLYLLPYGKTVAVGIDPIEKKPLFHFLPGSKTFSFGTAGCNFRCGNCQNYSISQIMERKGDVDSLPNIHWGQDMPPEFIVQQAIENQCQSIAYTYNEPSIFLEYALDTMQLAHQKGLKNIWVSNGYMSNETLDLILPYLDSINVDIKSFEEHFYRSNCGAHLTPVLENCQRLVKKQVWLEVTTLIIPTLSDNADMLRKLAQFIHDKLGPHVPWHVSAFSADISWKLQTLPNTTKNKIETAYQIGKEAGLQHVYAGNVPGSKMEKTFCSSCETLLIKRLGYSISRHDDHGVCPSCKTKLSGIFL